LCLFDFLVKVQHFPIAGSFLFNLLNPCFEFQKDLLDNSLLLFWICHSHGNGNPGTGLKNDMGSCFRRNDKYDKSPSPSPIKGEGETC